MQDYSSHKKLNNGEILLCFLEIKHGQYEDAIGNRNSQIWKLNFYNHQLLMKIVYMSPICISHVKQKIAS